MLKQVEHDKTAVKKQCYKHFLLLCHSGGNSRMFLGFVWDDSSMTKESLISNAKNTFYCFVIPEESQGLFSWFCVGCFQHDKRDGKQ
jgi:hypothetical protein